MTVTMKVDGSSVPSVNDFFRLVDANPGKTLQDYLFATGLPAYFRRQLQKQIRPLIREGGSHRDYVTSGRIRPTLRKPPEVKVEPEFEGVPFEPVPVTTAKPQEPSGIAGIFDPRLRRAAETAMQDGVDEDTAVAVAQKHRPPEAINLLQSIRMALRSKAQEAELLKERVAGLQAAAAITKEWKEEYRLRIEAETRLKLLGSPAPSNAEGDEPALRRNRAS